MSYVRAAQAASIVAPARTEPPDDRPVGSPFERVLDGIRNAARARTEPRRGGNASGRPGGLRPGDTTRPGGGHVTSDGDAGPAKRTRVDRLREPREGLASQELSDSVAGREMSPNIEETTQPAEYPGAPDQAPGGEQQEKLETADHETDDQQTDGAEDLRPTAQETQSFTPVMPPDILGAGGRTAARGGFQPVSHSPLSMPAQDSPANGTLNARAPALLPAAALESAAPAGSGSTEPAAGLVNAAAAPGSGHEAGSKEAGTTGSFQAVLTQVTRTRPPAMARPQADGGITTMAPPGKWRVDASSASEDLAQVLRPRFGARHSSLMLQLDPPELGRVRVDVQMHHQVMTVRFETETEVGRDVIQQRLRDLTGALEQQGVRLERVDVEYRPPPPQEQPGQDQPPPEHGGRPWSDPQHMGGRDHAPDWRNESGSEPQPGPPAAWLDEAAETVLGVDLTV